MTTPKKQKPTQRAVKAAEIAEAAVKAASALSTPVKAKKKAPARKATAKKPIVVGVLWCVVTFVIGSIGGIWVAKGIKIDAGQQDVLSDAYRADRISQVAILRELAQQPFDGSTDDGRQKAGEWFNSNRFKNRANDFGSFTDAVSEAIASNTEDKLADALEPKK